VSQKKGMEAVSQPRITSNRVLKNKHQAVSQGERRFGKRSMFDPM
jgi:hypothetical protein